MSFAGSAIVAAWNGMGGDEVVCDNRLEVVVSAQPHGEDVVNIVAIRNRFLNFSLWRRKDPFVAMLEAAPLDDEPLTEEDLRSLEEGRQDYLAGRTISADEVKRKYREQAARR